MLVPILSLVAACDSAREPAADELTIVVQGDRRELEQQEKSLREREEALHREKTALDARIADLSKSLKAAADAQQRGRIEEELRRQQAIAAQMGAQQSALVEQKSQMEAKRQSSETDKAMQAREARVADREAKVASREADLAAREKALQQQLAQLQQQLAQQSRASTPTLNPRDVPRAQALEAKHKKLLADIAERGILITDLPADEQPLNAEIWAARRQGDITRAWDLVGDLQKAIARLKVDQKFVEQKMVRLQGARSSARLNDAQRAEVEKLLRDVTSAYSDGKYEQANKGLNRIASILDANAASG